MGRYDHVFKEELEPTDRKRVKPVKLKLKEGYINPSFCSKPFDTLFYLRSMYEKEIKRAIDAGHIAPCGLEPSDWSSKAFPVVKGDGISCRIVADFKKLNRYIQRPVYCRQNLRISFSVTLILKQNTLQQWTSPAGIIRYPWMRKVRIFW